MSKAIDERVVSLDFDNKRFEQNASTTISTLDKLKQSLNLTGATDGLKQVDTAAKRIDLSSLSGAVESVKSRFSALEVMGITALANITNSAVNAGKRIASALTIDPIKTGFQEYETQINAVQTILANTESKGTTLQDVNRALDTLNTYADKTIYNFTEMTRNIGTFTAAGVDLDTSVNAIQGIANLAAVSGSNAQQASTAMYQLSQALSSGTVKLMDWNSVVNAGMGGQVFQDALKETARNHGVAIDKMIKKEGSFRETLQHGWLTSEILTETLSHFTMAAEEGSAQWDAYKKSLMDDGYTEKQATEILKLSNTATDAATKVKTLTQLWDTLKESAQSGWTQTWETIVGDFGESKELYTKISDRVGAMIGASADARNQLLTGALSSGWKQLLGQGIEDAEGFKETISGVFKDNGQDMTKLIEEAGGSFEDLLKTGKVDADILAESVERFTEKLSGMSAEELKAAGYTEDTVLKIQKLNKGVKDGTISMEEFAAKMVRPSGRELLIESLWNAFEGVLSAVKPIKEAFSEIFPAPTAERLYSIIESFRDFTESLTLSSRNSALLKRTFKGLFAIFDIGFEVVKALFGGFTDLIGAVAPAGTSILSVTASIGSFFLKLRRTVKQTDIFNKAVEKIGTALVAVKDFFKPVITGIKDFGKVVSGSFGDISEKAKVRFEPLKLLGEALGKIFSGLGGILAKAAPVFASIASKIGEAFQGLQESIGEAIGEADYNKFFDFLNGGIFAAIGIFIAKFTKSVGDITEGAGGFLENINDILGGVGDALNAFTGSLKAETLKKIAVSIGILAAALLVLSLIDSKKLTTALTAVSALFAELMISLNLFGKFADGNGLIGLLKLGKIGGFITRLAVALVVLSVALKILSTMSWEEMGVGLTAMVIGLGAMVAAVNFLPDSKVNKAAAAIKKLATSMVILAVALKIMGTMSWSELAVGLAAMVGGLSALVAAVNLLPKDTGFRAAGMVGLAIAMTILAGSLKIMATMTWEEIGKGLAVLAGSLAILAVAMNLMKLALPGALAMLIVAPALVVLAGAIKLMSGMTWEQVAIGLTALAGSLLVIAIAMTAMIAALPGALALTVVSAALMLLAPVLKTLGTMTWDQIVRGLVALAGAFAVIGIAGLVLKPLVGTLIALGASIALFGVGVLAAGAGIMAFAVGFTALAAALAAGGGAIVVFISSLIGLIPYIIEQIGIGLIKLCEVIAGSADAICKAFTVIVVALVDALVTSVPALVDGIMVLLVELMAALAKYTPTVVEYLFDFLIGVLNATAAKLPDLIQAAVNLLMAFFSGVVEALKGLDVSTLVNGIAGIGIMSAIMVALAAVAALVPAAMLGVVGMGLVIAELALVLAAIGGLAQIPGLEWLIGEGGKLLQTIGTAIGQFVGGIIGGIAQGATSTLPQIGSDLSAFMTNAKVFIDGAKSIDPSMLDGVKSLVGVILALTGANLLESLTSWLTGGSSLATFGEELAAFGPYMKTYSDSVKGIDESAVTASANAAKALSEMAANLPNSGGLAGWFAGENDLGTFGEQLVPFGKSMKAYSDAVAGIDAEAVAASTTAAKAISELADNLPNSGGVAGWFAGENDLATFAEQLVPFAKNLRIYSLYAVGIDAEAIANSADAAKSISNLAKNLPNSGGMVSWFTGDNDLGAFSSNLVSLGKALSAYSDSVGGVSSVQVGLATAHIKNIIDATSKMAGFDTEAVTSFSAALKKLAVTGIEGFTKAFSDSKATITSTGSKMMEQFMKALSSSKPKLVRTIGQIVKQSVAAIRTQQKDFFSAAAYMVQGFANGISANTYKAAAKSRAMAAAAAKAAKEELKEHSPSKVFYGIGDYAGVAFVNALGDYVGEAGKAGSTLAGSSIDGLKNAMALVNDIVNSDVSAQPTIRPVLDLSSVKSGANSIGSMLNGRRTISVDTRYIDAVATSMGGRQNGGGNDDIVKALKDLRKDLADTPRNNYNINGLSYGDDNAVTNAIMALVTALKLEGRA